jgi:hypothetical protein
MALAPRGRKRALYSRKEQQQCSHRDYSSSVVTPRRSEESSDRCTCDPGNELFDAALTH